MSAVVLGHCHSNLNKNMEKQIDELYAQMSQEERIAQLKSMYMEELFDEQGRLDTVKCRELIPNGNGAFLTICLPKAPRP